MNECAGKGALVSSNSNAGNLFTAQQASPLRQIAPRLFSHPDRFVRITSSALNQTTFVARGVGRWEKPNIERPTPNVQD